jgi:hypothetical protein
MFMRHVKLLSENKTRKKIKIPEIAICKRGIGFGDVHEVLLDVHSPKQYAGPKVESYRLGYEPNRTRL